MSKLDHKLENPIKPTSLYAYFGLVDLHNVDMPGHSLYQLGLMDSLKETYGEIRFDFFSYLPDNIIDENSDTNGCFPANGLGSVFNAYYDELIADYCPSLDVVLTKIANKEYNRLYLKARFRNLSTLAKKWKDALSFEKIVDAAISAGYDANDIIILDTDLSLPGSFHKKYKGKVEIAMPSIHFKGISDRFLNACIAVHEADYLKDASVVFYGNIDTSNYKSGNQKSTILPTCIGALQEEYMNNEIEEQPVVLIHKPTPEELSHPITNHINRKDRHEIWDALSISGIMLNVTKEKYDDLRFIPARIYEALIFGMVPVSYKFNWLSSTFSFETIEDMLEIVKYLRELDTSEDIKSAYLHFVKEYKEYSNSGELLYIEEASFKQRPPYITEADIYNPNR